MFVCKVHFQGQVVVKCSLKRQYLYAVAVTGYGVKTWSMTQRAADNSRARLAREYPGRVVIILAETEEHRSYRLKPDEIRSVY